MTNATKPIALIIIAIIVAASAGFYLSRDSSSEMSPVNGSIQSAAVPPGGGQFKGPENAPVTLVEFGDYQCPSCAYYHPIVNELMGRFPSQLRLEFHHFPLIQIHPNAMAAASAAEAAGEQGKFWEMHDLLFETQAAWSNLANPESQFISYASRIGLNVNEFMQDLRAPELTQRILEDVVRAREARVEAVPGFFVNGKFLPPPQTVNEFADIIQQHLSGQ